MREDHDRPLTSETRRASGPGRRGRGPAEGPRSLPPAGGADPARSREDDLARLSGARRGPQSRSHRRVPDRRDGDGAPRTEKEGGDGRGGANAGGGENPGRGTAREGVPAPTLGRDEAARHDRYGSGLPPRDPDRRRAYDRS